MAATVFQLFPQAQASPGQAQPTPGQAARPAAPAGALVDELRAAALSSSQDLLDKMFRGADDVLFGLSERAHSAGERRHFLDAMRVLRMEEAAITRAFLREIENEFNPLGRPARPEPVDLERHFGHPTEAMEEQVAVINMTSRAKSLHAALLADLQQRLGYAARDAGVAVRPQALSAKSVCQAVYASLEGLELAFPVRLVIYRLFDRQMISALGLLYETVLEVLARHGIGGAAPSAAAAAPATGLPPLSVDAQTIRSLEEVAGSAAAVATGDSALATEVLAIIRGKVAPGKYAIIQRVALVGQTLNDMLAEPHLVPACRAVIETARYPLLKTAFADSTFFLNAMHPVRQLLHESLLAATTVRMSGPASMRNIEAGLRQLAAQINLSAKFVVPALRMMEPFSPTEVIAFQESLHEQAAGRRESILGAVRRAVAQELEVLTLGRHLPRGAHGFLRSAIGPMMSVCLLKHGMNSGPWNEVMARVHQVFISLEPSATGVDRAAQRAALIAEVIEDLRGIGMQEGRISEVIENLRASYEQLDEEARLMAVALPLPEKPQAPAPQQPTVMLSTPDVANEPLSAADRRELLKRLLVTDAWFRVHEPHTGEIRWLKIAGHDLDEDRVAFSGFNADNTLALRASDFMRDLIAARSEPINPSPDMVQALGQLRGVTPR